MENISSNIMPKERKLGVDFFFFFSSLNMEVPFKNVILPFTFPTLYVSVRFYSLQMKVEDCLWIISEKNILRSVKITQGLVTQDCKKPGSQQLGGVRGWRGKKIGTEG